MSESPLIDGKCICDLNGDPDARYISRITRLKEANHGLAEQLEAKDAEITRLRTALTQIAALTCNSTIPSTVHRMTREIERITQAALGGEAGSE